MKFITLLGLSSLVAAAPVDTVATPVIEDRDAAQLERRAAPSVVIPSPQATVVGSSLGGVDSFNGIPFASPPTGNLRLKPPSRLTSPQGTVQATGQAAACPQMTFSTGAQGFPTNIVGELLTLPLFQVITGQEDCLTITVQRPSGISPSAKLPVLVYIFGGGFELGSSSMYNGQGWVSDSVKAGTPIIYVAMNYRIGGFGFMPGKEILQDGSSNLGLLDQRMALEWIADNIGAFGGDPSKVTIWGESAGSISVWDQMALYDGDNTYKGKPLFRGAMMNSGSIVPAYPVDGTAGQRVFETVVKTAGCDTASDKLACLRALPYQKFLEAANSPPGILSYTSVALSYLPRPDGKTLTQSPDLLATAGKYAKVPFIIGDQEDEGTLFSLLQANISTTDQLKSYFKTVFFPMASDEAINALVDAYPDSQPPGSPFRTGVLNSIYPQFKRLAAILGDITFTLTRRAFLDVSQSVHPDVPFWSYLSSYDYGTPILGTGHGTDILQVFNNIYPNYAGNSFRTYYISFVNTLNPNTNAKQYPNWPQWSKGKQLLNTFATYAGFITDDFRSGAYDVLVKYTKQLYI